MILYVLITYSFLCKILGNYHQAIRPATRSSCWCLVEVAAVTLPDVITIQRLLRFWPLPISASHWTTSARACLLLVDLSVNHIPPFEKWAGPPAAIPKVFPKFFCCVKLAKMRPEIDVKIKAVYPLFWGGNAGD